MANGTHARLYYSSPKASYEYINKKDGSLSGKLMLIENKEKNKIPENFEASKIMTKSER